MLGKEEGLVVIVYIVLLFIVFAVCLYVLDQRKRKNNMGTVSLNGKTVKVSGSNISVINGKIYSDDKLIELPEQKTIDITVEGDVQTLKVDACDQVTINGNCENVEAGTGNVKITGDVHGDVTTDTGNITCGNVGGNCETYVGNINRK